MEATECGAASLSMIFAYFGRYIPLEQMRIETGVSRDGCNAANLMRCAKKYGLECHGYRKEPEALKKLDMPCIIHWNFNHFVVLEGFKGKNAYINDPAVGRRKLTWEELDDSFTGVVLTFKKTAAFKTEKKKSDLGSFLHTHLKGQYGVLFKLFYIGLLLVFPGLVLPVLSQVFMDDILIGGYTDWLTRLLVFMGLLVLMKAGLTYYRSLILQKLRSKMIMMSGLSFLHHMFRLPISFFDQRYAGDLVGRMDNNNSVNEFLAGDLAETALNIFVAIFYLIILFLYSPVMTLIGLLNTAVLLLLVFLSKRVIEGHSMKLQISAGKLYGTVCAGISITDTIKASGAEEVYAGRILGYQAKNANLEQKMSRFQQIIGAIPAASGAITDALLLMAGGILVIRGQLTMGMLVAFNSLFDSFSEPVNALVSFVQKIQTMKSNISRVQDVLKYQQDESFSAAQNQNVRGKLSGAVELDGISFGYSRLKPPLVEDFSFRLNSGESIAVVGSSGCGKSTIAKVVSGLYRPWDGQVRMDGVPMTQIPKPVLNASIATVSQNITLFSGTIKDNLTMWNPAVLEEDMIKAAQDACIHDFIIQQPDGYNYLLEEGAANLSGGQRQRLEIARALSTKPSILIMDEATSALDPIVEKQILDNIKRRGCTCIIVAHRLSAIRDCNQIVVMKNGKIVQRGNHASLISQEGDYRRLIQSN
ncbi:MAG: NHLP family bacteriocin export ABC transporter peptidase/permease/ATPase subunit [Firmicutes bacterium]|nr:NHLP family bacteriocin export ABC transporter peptidase/permease/ATPase subunit [Bacillota bacterium]